MAKQRLSAKARAAKKKRDIEYAKSPARQAKKAQNQRIGQRSDSDLHHTGSAVKRVSIKIERLCCPPFPHHHAHSKTGIENPSPPHS